MTMGPGWYCQRCGMHNIGGFGRSCMCGEPQHIGTYGDDARIKELEGKLEALESAARGDGFDDETVRKLAAVMAERDALASRLDEIAKEVEFLTADRNNERNMRINAQAVRLRAEKDLAETESRLASCELALAAICDTNGGELYWSRETLDELEKEWKLELDDMGPKGFYFRLVERRVRICGAPLSSSRSKNCLLPEGHSGSHQFSTSPE